MDKWQMLPRCAVSVGDNVPLLGIVTYQSFSMDFRYVRWHFGEEHREPYHGLAHGDGRPIEAWTLWWDASTEWLDGSELVEIFGPVRDDRFLGVQ